MKKRPGLAHLKNKASETVAHLELNFSAVAQASQTGNRLIVKVWFTI